MPRKARFKAATEQPWLLAGLDGGNPLCAGLLAAWPNGGGSKLLDAVAGHHLALGFAGTAGGANFRGSRFGNTLFLDSGSVGVNGSSSDAALALSGATELTFSLWINPAVTGQTNTGLIGRWNGSGAMLYVNPELRIYINGTNVAGPSSVTSVAGQWVHVAGTWSGATQRAQLYVNGVQVADAALAQTSVSLASGIGFSLGTYNASNSTFKGGIAIPAVWRRRLSASQIAQLYREPWGIFETQRVERYVAASSGAAFTFTSSGGLSFSGAATGAESNNYAAAGAGGLGFAGAAAAVGTANYAQIASGGLAIGGAAPAASTSVYAMLAAGGISLGGVGAATETNSYNQSASGGLTLGGAAAAQAAGGFDFIGSGGLALSGASAAAFSASHLYAASGGIAWGGAAAASAAGSNAWVGTGGLSFGGAATSSGAYSYSFTGAGGLVLAGSALCSFDAGQLPSMGSDFYRYAVPRESLTFGVPGQVLTFNVTGEDLTYRVPST